MILVRLHGKFCQIVFYRKRNKSRTCLVRCSRRRCTLRCRWRPQVQPGSSSLFSPRSRRAPSPPPPPHDSHLTCSEKGGGGAHDWVGIWWVTEDHSDICGGLTPCLTRSPPGPRWSPTLPLPPLLPPWCSRCSGRVGTALPQIRWIKRAGLPPPSSQRGRLLSAGNRTDAWTFLQTHPGNTKACSSRWTLTIQMNYHHYWLQGCTVTFNFPLSFILWMSWPPHNAPLGT